MERKGNFDEFIVGNLPTMMYIPDFITDAEQSQLLENIYQAPISKWKTLKNRRLQNWGGIVHEKGLLPQELPPWLYKLTQRMTEESGLFPSPINHVLINEYLPNQGIMPHQDGPAYFPVVAILSLGSPVVMDFTPHSKLLSGEKNSDQESVAFARDESRDSPHSASVVMMPRSLLIFKDTAYSDYLHGIKDTDEHRCDKAVNKTEASAALSSGKAEVAADGDSIMIRRHETRTSLTCRLVPKVHKNLFRF